ncbi:c-type cytochrome [Phragmitibacter flavus]|uniref:C-type cytochrome n=1 Tax=Phragmitibacter flavus TaxID=2576071 RepID=A0A5R8KCP6_9BACT|nr:c-type cytochrome [Phragmitibacter flavus]TLD69369.1 c-type cytochrome [Phragmitibacter flavus]
MANFPLTTALTLTLALLTATLPAAEKSHPLIPAFERFFSPEQTQPSLEAGLLLLQEFNCTTCHSAPEAWHSELGQRATISLANVGNRLPDSTLKTFLSNPHAHKPGTLMPQLPLKPDQIAPLVTYLSKLKSNDPTKTKTFPQGNPHHGREIFHTIGCVACHAPDSPEKYHPEEVAKGLPVETPKLPSIPIRLAHDYPAQQLAAFLQAPLAIRHAGRMPDFALNDQQASDIASYLQQNTQRADWSKTNPSADQLAKGKKVFTDQRCNACHDTGKSDPLALVPAKTLTKLNPKNGCLSTSPNEAPHFSLNAAQRSALQLALTTIQQTPAPAPLNATQKSDRFLAQMNCYACHEWNGKGGLEKARAQYFTVNNPTAHSLGEIGLLPPKLNHAGRKLTRAWLEKLLWGENGGVRPYMTARMPRFGKENAESFIAPFAEACKSDTKITIDTSGLIRHQRAENGRILLGVGEKDSLGCVSCHGIKDRNSLGVPVINLTHTVDRLQPEYFKELLLNPQAVQPGTLMPPLLMGRKKADNEIEQMWIYLKEIDGARLPPGLLLEGDYELKPKPEEKPIVFRTFLEGAGTQAIAVGYPGGINLAFDTLEVRPALAWKGRFIDAMTTWEERAMTPAKPLGDNLLTLPTHIPFARLKSPTDPWPDTPGNRLGYQFKGYRIQPDGTPTFLYTIDDLKIQETLTPTKDGTGIQRHLVVESQANSKGWHFLGLSKNAKPQSLQFKNNRVELQDLISWPTT